jgi:hypothetical protein
MNLALMILSGQQPYLIIALVICGLFVGGLTVLEVRYRRAKKREEEQERQRVKRYPPFE